MQYTFRCNEHGVFSTNASIKTGPPQVVRCPLCQEQSVRVFTALPAHYHTQGFHQTDYSATGDKLEQLNKEWSKYYGEPPPKPDKRQPKNSADPY